MQANPELSYNKNILAKKLNFVLVDKPKIINYIIFRPELVNFNKLSLIDKL